MIETGDTMIHICDLDFIRFDGFHLLDNMVTVHIH